MKNLIYLMISFYNTFLLFKLIAGLIIFFHSCKFCKLLGIDDCLHHLKQWWDSVFASYSDLIIQI